MRILIAALFVCCLMLPARAEQEFFFSSVGGPNAAISFAVLEAAYAKLGIVIHHLKLPAERALIESSEGRTDGEVHRILAVEKSYPSLIRIPHPINKVVVLPYSCKKDISTTDWESLRGLSIGVRNGIRITEIHTEGMPSVVSLRSYDELFDLLIEGRLDVVVCDSVSGQGQIQRTKAKCLRTTGPPLVQEPLYHYLYEGLGGMAPKISKVLKEMNESRETQAIRQQMLKDLTTGR